MKKVRLFEHFIGEAARVGSSSWSSVLSDLKRDGWDIKGNLASKYYDEDGEERRLEIDNDGDDIWWTIYDGDDKELNSGSFDAEGLSAGELDGEVWSYIEESFIIEAFEVHYSDGVRAAKKFKSEKDAMSFTKEKIASGKCKEIAIYKAGSGFHSTADTEAVIAWWGDGSYLDNVSKKDSKLAAKKIEESFINESAEEKEAKAILQDLLGEYDPWELGDMTEDEAEETVSGYGHKGSKAKKIAEILFDLASNGIFEEATTSWSKMMRGVKAGGSGPWSLVAIENKKVVGQRIDIRTKEMLPAEFEALRREYPKAKIHIEDAGGMVVWNEAMFVNEAMFKAKDFDKTLVTYAIDTKADEIYVINVAKVIMSSFPDTSKVPDKRFHGMFGMMLEENWLKQYDKLPEPGDILPAPKKDKAFESKVNEAKILTRDEMIDTMRNKYGLSFVKTSEEFDGEEGGIWLGGSEGKLMPNAKDDMFNYYHGGSKYPQGIHKDLAKFLDKCGWYGQFGDPGTVFLWPKN